MVIVVLIASVQCLSLHGEPHYSILVGAQGTGSYQFAKELSRLWDVSKYQMPGFLVPAVEKIPENRLRRLRSRQGDFAILAPQQARLLAGSLEIVVITVLWPNALHVISPQTEISTLRIETDHSLYVHLNTAYFVSSWSQLLPLQNYNPNQFQWFSEANSLATLSRLDNGALLITAPYPLQEIHRLLLQPDYKLIPLDDRLISFNRERHPWLLSRPLPANIYPNTPQPVPTLTSFPVMVTRADTSHTLITQMLKILFPSVSTNHQNSFHSHNLFRFLEAQNNLLFRNSFRFHSASKMFFKL